MAAIVCSTRLHGRAAASGAIVTVWAPVLLALVERAKVSRHAAGCGTLIVMGDEEELRPSAREEAQSTRAHHEKAYMSELGHRLRSLREERGMTQQVLAQAAGIATDMVSRLENGHYSSPGLRTLLRIAEGMGLSVSALLPDVPSLNQASPEANLRARLNTLLHRVDLDDLELIVEIAGTIVARRRH